MSIQEHQRNRNFIHPVKNGGLGRPECGASGPRPSNGPGRCPDDGLEGGVGAVFALDELPEAKAIDMDIWYTPLGISSLTY